MSAFSCGILVAWLHLSHRTFSVRASQLSSATVSLTLGIQQGSALGPLLFSFLCLSNNYLVLDSNKTEAMIIAPPSQALASFCSSAKFCL